MVRFATMTWPDAFAHLVDDIFSIPMFTLVLLCAAGLWLLRITAITKQ